MKQIDATPAPATRTALLRSPKFLDHRMSHHPERPERLQAIEAELARQGLLSGRSHLPFAPADPNDVERVHNPWYVETVERLAERGGGWLDADTYVTPQSYDVALWAAGAAVAAVDAVLGGVAPRAFALVRPPGHHATPERGMGFCLFNNIAIAAARALSRGLERVLIFDWDVHHGNGTQDVFYDSSAVMFCSIHQHPFYPGTGTASERGIGSGEGYTLNLPLPAGRTDDDYIRIVDEVIVPAAYRYRPELILISAGYDAHAHDPLGGMRLTERGFAAMTRLIADAASDLCGGRIVAVLEGGYDVAALGRCIAATVRELDGTTSARYDEHSATSLVAQEGDASE
jgi:acetoin utilization deacetylase AcuC-like enzyme